MKTFKNKLLENMIYDILNEASIYDDKYPPGSKFVLKSDKVNTVRNLTGINDLEPSDIFIKKEESDEFTPIGDETGTPIYFEVKGQSFKLTKSPSAISTYFNHYKDSNTGVDWKDISLETAALIGLYIPLSEINQFSEKAFHRGGDISEQEANLLRTKILNTLSVSNDWIPSGVKLIQKGIKNFNLADIRILLSSMRGMAIWKEEVLNKHSFSSIHFIHNKINDYYKSEENNPHIEKQGQKANTADVIISNKSVDETLEIVESKPLKYDNSSGLVFEEESGLKMFQVSLKKGRSEAQLGKIFAVVKDAYGLPSFDDLLNTVITEGFISTVLSKMKTKAKEFSGLVKFVFSKISGWFNKSKKKLQNDLNKSVNKSTNDLFKKIGANRLVEKKQTFSDKLKELSDDEIKNIYVELDKSKNYLSQLDKRYDFIATSLSDQIKQKTKRDLTDDEIIKLFANYTSFEVIKKFVNEENSTMSDMVDSILILQKEMSFGKTTLPVYKVYGVKFGDNDSYDYLGGSKEYLTKKREQLLQKNDLPVIGVLLSSQTTKFYYSIMMDIIYGIEEDGNPLYSNIALRTNRGGGQFSFVVEGSKIFPSEQFVKKYNL